jgi:energy-coupling factor transport system permease protein
MMAHDVTSKMPGRLARIDPRTRLLMTIGLATAITQAQSWPELLILISIVSLFYLWTAVSWHAVYRYLRPFIWLALVAILLAKGEEGLTLVQVGQWRYTSGDAMAGLWTAVKLLLLITSAIWLTITTSATALAAALRSLLRPLERIGIPVEAFSLALLVAMRFLPLLTNETRRIQRAQTARGIDLVRGLRGVWRRTASMVIPVFNAGMRRADKLADALVVRGYHAKRYPLETLTPMRSHDYILLTIVALILGLTWLI